MKDCILKEMQVKSKCIFIKIQMKCIFKKFQMKSTYDVQIQMCTSDSDARKV